MEFRILLYLFASEEHNNRLPLNIPFVSSLIGFNIVEFKEKPQKYDFVLHMSTSIYNVCISITICFGLKCRLIGNKNT